MSEEQMEKVADIRQPTKADLKKQRIYLERRQRKLNEGMPEEMVDQALAREDYDRLPVEDKLRRHEHYVHGALERLAQEMTNLRYNDGVLADALDMNFKAISKMLSKLGVPVAEQQTFMQEAIKEVELEKEQKLAAKAVARAHAAEEARKAEAAAGVGAPGAAEPPPEATSFGG